MLKQIFFQSDWWLHLLSALAVWGIAYLIEANFLKRKFAAKKFCFNYRRQHNRSGSFVCRQRFCAGALQY